MSFIARLLRHKSVEQLQAEIGSRHDFRRVLGVWQLTAIGIGGIIGVGVFVLAGQQAALNAGPAVALSFIIAGIASAAAALCYAEFAGLIPVTGSAYTYSYATLGELIAWLIGWDLLLEYALIVAVVAIGWSGYVQAFLSSIGIVLPTWAQGAIGTGEGRVFNVIAAAITFAVAALLIFRTEWGARFNTFVVAVKVAAVLLVLVVGVFYINPANWHPFIPERVVGADGIGHFGYQGIATAAAVVFFAVFGYDTLTTAAEESKNPQRDLPVGMLASLAICTVLYIAMAAVMTGLTPYSQLGTDEPVVTAVASHPELAWLRVVVEIGALIGLSSVVLVMIIAQPRIFMIMGRDGLLPRLFTTIHPRYRTPHINTVITGIGIALLAAVFPLDILGELTSMGTLIAFAAVCGGVWILRHTQPELPRPFRIRYAPLVCLAGIVSCCILLSTMTIHNWMLMLSWTAFGMLVYFAYGYRHSRLRGG